MRKHCPKVLEMHSFYPNGNARTNRVQFAIYSKCTSVQLVFTSDPAKFGLKTKFIESEPNFLVIFRNIGAKIF